MRVSKRALFWFSVLLATSFLVFLCAFFAQRFVLLRSAPHGLLYAAGKEGDWKAYGGTWTFSADSIRNDSLERGSKLTAGSIYWKDYSLDADLEEEAGQFGDAGLVVRSSKEERGADSYSGYFVGLRERDSSLMIGRSDYGWSEYGAVRLPSALRAFHWYHLKVVAVGCTIAARFTDPATGEVSSIEMNEPPSQCATTGRIALRSVSTAAEWRNIRAVQATASDLRQILVSADLVPISHALTLPEFLEEYRPSELPSQPTASPQIIDTTEPIDDLRRTSVLGTDQISVRGKVMLTFPVLFVQDSTGGAMVPNVDVGSFNVGDEVLVHGKSDPHPFSSVIRNATVALLWPEDPDPPLSITSSQAATGAYNDRFIELQAYLAGWNKDSAHRIVLDLYRGDQRFRALLQGRDADPIISIPAKESLLQVRGICVSDSQFTNDSVPFTVLLRSADDIKVASAPPWWSKRNLIRGTTIVLFLSLLGYLSHLRIKQWRLQGIVEERLRLAHELHDTLAQSFAGIGYQLRAILKNLPDSPSPLQTQVETAAELVHQGHLEARRSISTLRTDADGLHAELLASLEQAALRMISDGSIVVETSASGDQRRIPLKLTAVLFRIGLEAIANAVRHANASRIKVHLDYQRAFLQFNIEDNGVGFTPEEATPSGFGLNGIRARAHTVGGTVRIFSSPGSGTRLQVNVPLPPLPFIIRLFPWLMPWRSPKGGHV